eukprot:TRINITY_DN2979_c0_g2_i7.p2 TRINITY_DN2979_c0_g2~~TRINITY_DN2979_c0_g2_i7.p2  ORF type:complete len:180 (+),score=27.78 TRINITY_DN2979_c0_g2_i7:78-617(+)
MRATPFVLLSALLCSVALSAYNQCAPQWGEELLTTKTMCAAGCVVTSIANMLTGWGIECGVKPCNPAALSTWLKKHGGLQQNLFVWSAIEQLGVKYTGITPSKTVMRERLNKGEACLLYIANERHWVLASGKDNNVIDPKDIVKTVDYTQVNQAGCYRKAKQTESELKILSETSRTKYV